MATTDSTMSSTPLEAGEHWAEIRAALEGATLHAVAAKFGVAPTAIRAALRRTGGGGRTRVVRPKRTDDEWGYEAPTSPASKADSAPPPREPKRSSAKATPAKRDRVVDAAPSAASSAGADHPVAPHRPLLGTMSDGDVAKLAGVTMWVVRGYRIREGIAAYDRWAPTNTGPGAATPTTRPGGRRSRDAPAVHRLEPFAHLLGVETDRTIAKKARVSIETVRNVRRARGIASTRRDDRPELKRPQEPQEPQEPLHVASGPTPRQAAQAPESLVAWRVLYGVVHTLVQGVVLGATVSDAAREVERVGVMNVVRIERIGRLL